jgi:hypothetical protein
MFIKNMIYMYTQVTIVWLIMNNDMCHEKINIMIYEFTYFTLFAQNAYVICICTSRLHIK